MPLLSEFDHSFAGASAAVDALVQARRDGAVIPLLTRSIGPITLPQAYSVQDALASQLTPVMGPVCGQKIAFTTAAAFKRMGISEPVAGPLFSAQVRPSG